MPHRPPSFFDVESQLDKIYQINGFLPKPNARINWEIFRYTHNKIREKERLSNAGAKPYDESATCRNFQFDILLRMI